MLVCCDYDVFKKAMLVGVREENAKDRVGWKQMIFTVLIFLKKKKTLQKFPITALLI